MRIQAGKSYRTAFGEVFGPMRESKEYALPFFCFKNGSLYTFHAHGGYDNNPNQKHFMDLVA